jgi:aminopeptidase-like protein
MFAMLVKLWPLHRTLNSDDTSLALEYCCDYLSGVPTITDRYVPKTEAFTWVIPERYHVREAWLEIEGERVADFCVNPLHLVSFSLPKVIDTKLGAIRDHLWTSPKRPSAIPWEFKYYERSWGFCLRHQDLEKFDDEASVKGLIDVSFSQESFELVDAYLPGEEPIDLLFLTNICHPWQVNDSITGLVVGLEFMRALAKREKRRYGVRLLICPETVGTVAWFARHQDLTKRIAFAWFCEMVGHDNSFVLQHSRQGSESLIDRAFMVVLASHRNHGAERTGKFREVVASDEMVSNGPGFDIPTPSLTRWPYPEYHTSDDNPGIIQDSNLNETLEVFVSLYDVLERNYFPRRLFKGPIMLSRFGLWIDWRDNRALNLALEHLMMMLEGNKSVIDISFELDVPIDQVFDYLERMRKAGLIEALPCAVQATS